MFRIVPFLYISIGARGNRHASLGKNKIQWRLNQVEIVLTLRLAVGNWLLLRSWRADLVVIRYSTICVDARLL